LIRKWQEENGGLSGGERFRMLGHTFAERLLFRAVANEDERDIRLVFQTQKGVQQSARMFRSDELAGEKDDSLSGSKT